MIPGIALGAAVKSVPKWAWIALGAVLLIVAFYMLLDAYGDARFDAGKAKADAEWQAAQDKLIAEAAKAGTEADRAAAGRAADYAAKVADEKERIDKAVEEGSSPIDVLFGTESGQ